MKYMLLMNHRDVGGEGVASWPAEDFAAHVKFMRRFGRELQDTGELVAAEGLAPPSEARIVRADQSGAPEVTDGPFAETKEFLAGYWIVDVDSPERAYEIAARASAAPGVDGIPLRMPIEVRAIPGEPAIE